MVLDNRNAETIAAHFKNKWPIVEYFGCWNSDTITFVMWQDCSEKAGFQLTIKRPKGDYLEEVKVTNVKPIYVTTGSGGRIVSKTRLPFLISQKQLS